MLQPWSGKTNIRNGKEALIMKKLSKLVKEYYESFSAGRAERFSL